jgi:RHS repeat-associated protein
MTQMPHLAHMEWDFKDQLQATRERVVNRGCGETTYYVYDAAGQRVRKVTESATGSRRHERIYLAGFEVYREYDSVNAVTLERQTLHVMDDKQRVALVESRTRGDDGSPCRLVRYQFGNHLGSACLEVDEQAVVISYEEYTPYGSTSYQSMNQSIKAAAKRYRYTGKERDEQTGLYYHGARYYVPWLGRWVNPDPLHLDLRDQQSVAFTNSYWAFDANPIRFTDTLGMAPEDANASMEIQHSRILKALTPQFRQEVLAAEKAIPWDPSKYQGKTGYFRWRADIGTRAHKRLQIWAKERWPDVKVELPLKEEGTILDLSFTKEKLDVELKSTMTGLMNSPEQQARQVGGAGARGRAYAAVTAAEQGQPGSSYYLSAGETARIAKEAGWSAPQSKSGEVVPQPSERVRPSERSSLNRQRGFIRIPGGGSASEPPTSTPIQTEPGSARFPKKIGVGGVAGTAGEVAIAAGGVLLAGKAAEAQFGPSRTREQKREGIRSWAAWTVVGTIVVAETGGLGLVALGLLYLAGHGGDTGHFGGGQ